jgi:protein required for attachment to host cells
MSRLLKPMPHRPHVESKTWVVCADAGRARIFESSPIDGALLEFIDLLNPDARQHDTEAMSDRRGHVTQGPAGIGHAFAPRQSHAEHVAERFAKDLCDHLDAAERAGEVEKLYVIADPGFLGLMRAHLKPATRTRVVGEVASDLARRSIEQIRGALPAKL